MISHFKKDMSLQTSSLVKMMRLLSLGQFMDGPSVTTCKDIGKIPIVIVCKVKAELKLKEGGIRCCWCSQTCHLR